LPDEVEDIRRIDSSSFDYENLTGKIHNPQDYGAALSECLFQKESKAGVELYKV
jgi:hypothetical protein